MSKSNKTSSKKYSIIISPPDFFTYEPYEDFEKHLLKCWVDASKIFSHFEFKYGQDTISIKTDWSKFKDQFKYSIDTSDELIITVSGNATLVDSFSDYFITRFLEMMYLTMNLAAPGTFNIWKEELRCLDDDSRVFSHTVSLSSSPFEHFWETCGELNYWPRVIFMPLKKSVDWYVNLNITLKARASAGIERCLFALINFSNKGEGPFSAANLLWITHSLEALYNTPKEGILNALRNRIFLFLGDPHSHKNEFKKKINSLYELRSQFVHGTMEVAREPFFENIDKDLQEYMQHLNDTCDFGIMLLVATLQKIILAKGKNLNFHEKYEIDNK